MKERKFWLPFYSPVWYKMQGRKTIKAVRRVFIFGICIAQWDVFIPD